eukprot:scaffold9940_cov64-Phaeocystis_antarctica.AAC.3
MAGRSILRPSGSRQALPSVPPRLCVSPAACAAGGGERRPQGRLSAWCNQNDHFVARQHLNGWALDSAAFGLASGAPLYTPAPVHIACSPCGRWRRAEAAGPPLGVVQPEWPFCRQAAPKWLGARFCGLRARFRRPSLPARFALAT